MPDTQGEVRPDLPQAMRENGIDMWIVMSAACNSRYRKSSVMEMYTAAPKKTALQSVATIA